MRHCLHQFPMTYFIFLCNRMPIHTKPLREIFFFFNQWQTIVWCFLLFEMITRMVFVEWLWTESFCLLKMYIVMLSSLLSAMWGGANSLDGGCDRGCDSEPPPPLPRDGQSDFLFETSGCSYEVQWESSYESWEGVVTNIIHCYCTSASSFQLL